MTKPSLVSFQEIKSENLGNLSIGEYENQIPFAVNRVFWTYETPEEIIRGRHAHHDTEMILIAMTGVIKVYTEMLDGENKVFTLDNPSVGVYLPKYCWHTMQYMNNAVQLVLASTRYNEADYIRDYKDFIKLK